MLAFTIACALLSSPSSSPPQLAHVTTIDTAAAWSVVAAAGVASAGAATVSLVVSRDAASRPMRPHDRALATQVAGASALVSAACLAAAVVGAGVLVDLADDAPMVGDW